MCTVLVGIFNVKIQYNVSLLWFAYVQTYTAEWTDSSLSDLLCGGSLKKDKSHENKVINLKFLLVVTFSSRSKILRMS